MCLHGAVESHAEVEDVVDLESDLLERTLVMYFECAFLRGDGSAAFIVTWCHCVDRTDTKVSDVLKMLHDEKTTAKVQRWHQESTKSTHTTIHLRTSSKNFFQLESSMPMSRRYEFRETMSRRWCQKLRLLLTCCMSSCRLKVSCQTISTSVT